ncbi:competence protein CoiA, partial [Neobacillus cucumis]|uniref:competence protein CoiA n=1 Tax=Neobacillus cucumis TaxID=1740721 RepID=UPI002E23990B|nr:competence protein CoiA family protein [Neobacillus cucumis]
NSGAVQINGEFSFCEQGDLGKKSNNIYERRRVILLTALTKTGKKICLGYDYSKETLLLLRSKEEFVCPICGETLLLKLGDQRIFHFAHKKVSQCRDIYENETFEHLEGKKQLFQWLIKQKIPSVLEYYDRNIQQRPDILFQFKGQKYSLEYQCSSISDKVFSKRTRTYLDNGYTPLWIMSSQHPHPKRKDLMTLSNFEYSFLRSSPSGCLYIPTYCPESHHFQLVESITSLTIKNCFAHLTTYPLESIRLDSILEPKNTFSLSLSYWKRELDRVLLNWTLHPQNGQKALLQEVYNKGLNLFLLPPEIGLPVAHSVLIQTPPFIWQTYLYLDVLANKKLYDFITLDEVKASLEKRIYKKQIILRNLPQIENILPITPLIEYLQQLERLGLLMRKGGSIYQLYATIQIPKSNREKEEAKQIFLSQYGKVLSKF